MRNRDKRPPKTRQGRSIPGPPQSLGVVFQMGLPSRFVTLTSVVEPARSGVV